MVDRRRLVIGISAVLAIVLLSLAQIWGVQRSPTAWTAGNLLPNADWSQADAAGQPAGWTLKGTAQRVDAGSGYVLNAPYALKLPAINSVARSPEIAVLPGQRYRLGFQALVDPGTQRGQNATRLQVWIHWIDAANDDIQIDKTAPQSLGFDPDGAPSWTPVLLESGPAPPSADRLAISIHGLADDWIFIDNLQLNAAGVYLEPWPHGARAAVSFSVDWETAMGGYLHSFSETSVVSATQQGLQSRLGTAQLLQMLGAVDRRGTWFGNGYNFLDGNQQRRTWLGNPTFGWATASRRWATNRWASQPWFADDPYGSVATDPAWYFGDLTRLLLERDQAIESHTFSHLNVGFASTAEVAADLDAWRSVAAERQVGAASALAFPWGGSAGMTDAHWQALSSAGITAVTRTQIESAQTQYRLVERSRHQLRRLPGHDILVFPDYLLNPEQQAQAAAALAEVASAGGVLDFWAHTHEITTPAQQATWRSTLEAAAHNPAIWVASVPEIAAYWRAIRQLEIKTAQSAGLQRISVYNPGSTSLTGVGLQLPAGVEHVESSGALTKFNNQRLVLDLRPGETVEINLWLAP